MIWLQSLNSFIQQSFHALAVFHLFSCMNCMPLNSPRFSLLFVLQPPCPFPLAAQPASREPCHSLSRRPVSRHCDRMFVCVHLSWICAPPRVPPLRHSTSSGQSLAQPDDSSRCAPSSRRSFLAVLSCPVLSCPVLSCPHARNEQGCTTPTSALQWGGRPTSAAHRAAARCRRLLLPR